MFSASEELLKSDFCHLYTSYDFMQEYLYIRQKNNKISKLSLNKEQQHIDNLLNQQKANTGKVRAIILKSRQIGSTTLVAARGYYFVVTNQGVRGLVLAHRQSASNNIFDIINRFQQKMPANLQPKILSNRNKSITFKEIDSSFVFATAGSNEIGRSDTIQFFHGSEVAFWDNANNHLSSILMAVPHSDGSEVILESTSSGSRGLFYDMCMEAEQHKNEYQLIFLPWHWHEEYRVNDTFTIPKQWQEYGQLHHLDDAQIRWAYKQNRLLNVNLESSYDAPSVRFYQEFPASVSEAFKSGSNNLLMPPEQVLQKALNHNEAQELVNHSMGNNPIILGVDVARGGGDYSWIVDRQGNLLGFNLNEKIDSNDTMQLVGWITKHMENLNPYKVCIDAGGGGVGVYDRLKEVGYGDKVFLVNFASKPIDGRKYCNKRAEMWGELREFIYGDGYIIRDETLIHQISSVEYFYNSSGQLQLEPKENIKGRIKQSPDGGDACALTFAYNGMFRSFTSTNHNNFPSSQDVFNPFNW